VTIYELAFSMYVRTAGQGRVSNHSIGIVRGAGSFSVVHYSAQAMAGEQHEADELGGLLAHSDVRYSFVPPAYMRYVLRMCSEFLIFYGGVLP
jgi:hypothetical protein